jgi:hypothetical protein
MCQPSNTELGHRELGHRPIIGSESSMKARLRRVSSRAFETRGRRDSAVRSEPAQWRAHSSASNELEFSASACRKPQLQLATDASEDAFRPGSSRPAFFHRYLSWASENLSFSEIASRNLHSSLDRDPFLQGNQAAQPIVSWFSVKWRVAGFG